MKMSLAQALRKRAEVIAEIQTLQSRVAEAITFREDCPVYTMDDFKSMRAALDQARARLVDLKTAIDRGNHTSFDGKTVYGLITRRGEMKAHLEFWASLRSRVSCNDYRYDKDAPKTVSRLSVKEIDAEVDNAKKTLREIDDTISNINGKLDIDV